MSEQVLEIVFFEGGVSLASNATANVTYLMHQSNGPLSPPSSCLGKDLIQV